MAGVRNTDEQGRGRRGAWVCWRKARAWCVLVLVLIVPAALAVVAYHTRARDATEEFEPRPLHATDEYTALHVPTLLSMPVSVSHWQDERYLCCNYSLLQEVDVGTGAVVTLTPVPRPATWEPTGVCSLPAESGLLVANYHGHDVLEMTRQGDKLQTVCRYVHPGMTSPESVALSNDGQLVAAADYDGHRLWVFHRGGELAWSRNVGWAHSVAFGPDFLLATSLKDRSISKFDLSGNLQAATGHRGWGDDGYLWPTCVYVRGQDVFVSDAHTGKITVLDHSLHAFDWFGGNGPGPALFNMPYALAGRAGELVVCDTFKHRLLVLDDLYRCCRSLSCKEDPVVWNMPLLPSTTWRGYVNLSVSCPVHLPGLPAGDWHPAYGGYKLSERPGAKDVLYPPCGGLFNEPTFPYWCWLTHVSVGGRDYLLLGHSQGTLMQVVDGRGCCCPVDTDQDLWWTEKGLRTDAGLAFEPAAFVAKAAATLAAHDELVRAGTEPVEAVRRLWRPELSREQFLMRLEKSFASPAGKTFWSHWPQAQTPAEREEIARAFDRAVADSQESVPLEEVFLRNMLAPPAP